ncbi:HNH endonuclease [Jeongeupia chitinilytica]|uniref:HNH nuclease domain-containing protein n=1 Tax=Jeongeupia chitinilytica TaxID=1041641 RepID=A0ABQ3GVF3_9NEIS|nr:HNH endonuclease signature motif containing protein [Jeongeupia chitinilytica]GHD56961.1 hypothetical protein GCM10007350_04930 [Jeongeupia chitinilytica]
MTTLADLKPRQRARVMDLLSEVGLDVSDWANFKGGVAKAASNPKYCYEWSFLQDDHPAIVNLWVEEMDEDEGVISHRFNIRAFGLDAASKGKSTWKNRADRMDGVLQKVWRHSLPVRVILCAGRMTDADVNEEVASRVLYRALDAQTWALTKYDMMSGEYQLVRDAPPGQYVDQFSLNVQPEPPAKVSHETSSFIRSARVRMRVLQHAEGLCEYCSTPGFTTHDGRIYLETHHVVPLSEGGPDEVENVVALCPEHHRRAHYGDDRQQIRTKLLETLSQRSAILHTGTSPR